MTEDADPERWPVVWADMHYEDWRVHRKTMSEFLLEIIADPPLGLAELAGADLASSPPFKAFPPRLKAVDLKDREEQIRQAGADFPALPDESEPLLTAVIADGVKATATDWAAVARQAGVEFPADYRRFYDALGPGVFCDITIVGPEAAAGWNLWDLLQTGRDRLIPSVPYVRFHPDAGGAIPWGVTPDGWLLCWQTWAAGPPSWTVVAVGPQLARSDFTELSFASFLLNYSGVWQNRNIFLLDHVPWSGPPAFRGAGDEGVDRA
ncbi:hypothetical protein Ate02nite_67250 [Paractinoplanes tereljensis]|uniref:Knr4/Smi1-like domain-containing protein n=1 Tax=Paractinoplanes tereljensis TaxID=571912 RepID=A0A919NRY8_9ACTN|nr:hypothetical protein Ate02nite_67250 [Actinoplanes tereljensis]